MTYSQILPLDNKIRVTDQFGFTPLSVLEPTKRAKAKWKDAYLDDGIKEIRRSEEADYLPGLGFSEFHAELAEMILLYWSMVGSVVVDPFAGRATRAYVASKLGRQYFGYEIAPSTHARVISHINKHQLNKDNLNTIVYEDDGCKMAQTVDDFAHLVMTCPPYGDIEKYESVEGQLSDIKNYDDFLAMIVITAENIKRVLKAGGFVAWVCGDWRNAGILHSFHSDTINIFTKVGLIHWDTIIIKNISPFASNQMGKVASKRYTSKIHEYLLVFRKEGELEIISDKIKNERKNKFF